MMFMDHLDEIIETKKYNENLSLHVCFDVKGLSYLSLPTGPCKLGTWPDLKVPGSGPAILDSGLEIESLLVPVSY